MKLRSMAEVSAGEPSVSEPLTWKEVCERYPDQWVVLVELVREGAAHDSVLRTARVAGAGKSRREPLEQSRPLRSRYPSFAHYFTGPTVRSIAHLLR